MQRKANKIQRTMLCYKLGTEEWINTLPLKRTPGNDSEKIKSWFCLIKEEMKTERTGVATKGALHGLHLDTFLGSSIVFSYLRAVPINQVLTNQWPTG